MKRGKAGAYEVSTVMKLTHTLV